MKEDKGYFVISLDFELMWGVLDQPNKDGYTKNVIKGKETIAKVLDLFLKYRIHATWAIVGLMFLNEKSEIGKYRPDQTPRYRNPNCSAYNHLDEILDNGDNSNLYFAKNIISNIKSIEGQEIGSHTFSHYYCNEDGADPDSFYQDLLAAQKIAQQAFNIELKSLVFPRNQAKKEFVAAAEKAGFLTWRGNAKGYAVNNNPVVSILNRIARLIDTYLPLFGYLCYDAQLGETGIKCEKSSRFFRPYSERLKLLESLKLWRIKQQMSYAAKKKKVFHLWWHPHNFGGHPDIMISQLEAILRHYKKLNTKYGYISCSMRELADI